MKGYIQDKNFQKIAGACVLILLLWGSTSKDRVRRPITATTKHSKGGAELKTKKKGQGNVDAVFWNKIKTLIKVVVPRTNCKETKYLVILSLLLVLRTYMSIWLADVNGKL